MRFLPAQILTALTRAFLPTAPPHSGNDDSSSDNTSWSDYISSILEIYAHNDAQVDTVPVKANDASIYKSDSDEIVFRGRKNQFRPPRIEIDSVGQQAAAAKSDKSAAPTPSRCGVPSTFSKAVWEFNNAPLPSPPWGGVYLHPNAHYKTPADGGIALYPSPCPTSMNAGAAGEDLVNEWRAHEEWEAACEKVDAILEWLAGVEDAEDGDTEPVWMLVGLGKSGGDGVWRKRFGLMT